MIMMQTVDGITGVDQVPDDISIKINENVIDSVYHYPDGYGDSITVPIDTILSVFADRTI